MTEPITARQFHFSSGVGDWRVADGGACAYFPTGLRLFTIAPAPDGLSSRDVEMARRISSAAQQLDAPRPQRNRIHLDVWVPHDQAEARFAAAATPSRRRPAQTVSCSRARSIRVVASRTTCFSSSVSSAERYSTIQAILGRSWIIHGVSRSPDARREFWSWPSSRPPQVGHLGAGVVMVVSMALVPAPVHQATTPTLRAGGPGSGGS